MQRRKARQIAKQLKADRDSACIALLDCVADVREELALLGIDALANRLGRCVDSLREADEKLAAFLVTHGLEGQ